MDQIEKEVQDGKRYPTKDIGEDHNTKPDSYYWKEKGGMTTESDPQPKSNEPPVIDKPTEDAKPPQ
jgi:hypothetical protein